MAEQKQVTLANGDIQLAGTLQSAGDSKDLAVLIIAGSGATDRDGNNIAAGLKNSCLKYLANGLAEHKVASLRVDKRGVGASSPKMVVEKDLRFSNYVDDASAWVKYLHDQGYKKVVIAGHSEGAMVATLAAQKGGVDSIILLAGMGRPAGEVLREQLKGKLPAPMYQDADAVIAQLEKGQLVEKYPPVLASVFRSDVQPYMISLLAVEPAEELAKLDIPVLVIQGSEDLQVTMVDARLLGESAKRGKLVEIEGMNHVLKSAKGPMLMQLSSYQSAEPALHDDLLVNVLEFLASE